LRILLGYALVALSCIAWGIIFVLPFIDLEIGKIAALSAGLIVAGEVTFYLGILLLGKEAWEKLKLIFRKTRSFITNSTSMGNTMAKDIANKTGTTLGGAPVTLFGTFPSVGQIAPAFTLVDKDLKDVTLQSFAGQRKVLNIVPSLDTAVCATSTRKFNEAAAALNNTAVLVISADLPFAMGRFCVAEGLENVTPLSLMRGRDFMRNYGVKIADTVLAGLTARAVLVLDENDRILHAELVDDITHEPDYAAALAALN